MSQVDGAAAQQDNSDMLSQMRSDPNAESTQGSSFALPLLVLGGFVGQLIFYLAVGSLQNGELEGGEGLHVGGRMLQHITNKIGCFCYIIMCSCFGCSIALFHLCL